MLRTMCGCSTTFFLFSFFFSFFPTLFLPLLTIFFHSALCPLCPCLSFMEDGVGFLDLPCFCPFLGLCDCLLLFLASLAHWALFLSFSSFYGPFASILLSFCFFLCLWACFLSFPIELAHWALFCSFFLVRAFMAHLLLSCFPISFLYFFFLCLLLGLPTIRPLLLKTKINGH